MWILAPDILELSRQLSPMVCIVGLLLGALLWSLGASSYRFWLALMVTVAAGGVGLNLGRANGGRRTRPRRRRKPPRRLPRRRLHRRRCHGGRRSSRRLPEPIFSLAPGTASCGACSCPVSLLFSSSWRSASRLPVPSRGALL